MIAEFGHGFKQGTIRRPRGCATYCEQRTDDPPDSFDAFLSSSEASAWIWRGRLDIRGDWLDRWHTLSHGERKRSQIALALWMELIVLAVDEPTNHLDRAARKTLFQELRFFRESVSSSVTTANCWMTFAINVSFANRLR